MEGKSGHIGELFRKYRQGIATPEEKARMAAFFYQRGRQAELERLIDDTLGELPPEDWDSRQGVQAVLDRVRENIGRQLPEESAAPARRPRIVRWLPYAAAVAVLALAVGVWLAIGYQQSAVSLAATEILPGGNKATLTLADGTTVDLSSEQSGIVIGAEVITYNDGSSIGDVMVSGVEPSLPNSAATRSTPLRSLPTGQAGLPTGQAGAQGDAPAMLSLATPKGGTYQITLPDGSKVWLNANSTLRYPSRFTGDSREVILEGEAYFEIKKIQGTRDTRAPASNSNADGARVSRVPFKVLTAGQVVEVLGTQFNISAYADESETKTTLVEGKVKVTPGTGKGASDFRTSLPAGRQGGLSDLILHPGEQSITREANIDINKVDTYRYTAWKEGQFNFTAETLGGAMQQVGRWYDIEVVFADEVLRGTRVSAIVGRDEKLSALLELFESAGDLRFQLAGRTLTITGK